MKIAWKKNVTFNSKEDITLIEYEGKKRKDKKSKKRANNIKDEEDKMTQSLPPHSARKHFISIPGWMTLRRKKKKVMGEENMKNPNVKDAKDSITDNNNVVSANDQHGLIINTDDYETEGDWIKVEKMTTSVTRQSSLPSSATEVDESAQSSRQSRLYSESLVVRREKKSKDFGVHKETRVISATSERSSGSFSELSSDIRQKIDNWRTNSLRSGKGSPKVVISSPLEVDVSEGNPLQKDLHCQIDQSAQIRLQEVYQYLGQDGGRDGQGPPPPLPPKPISFHIKQLEKLLSGKINPGPLDPERKEAALIRLGSLKVLQNMDFEGGLGDKEEEAIYDLPRILEDIYDDKSVNFTIIQNNKRLEQEATYGRCWEDSVSGLSLSSSSVASIGVP